MPVKKADIEFLKNFKPITNPKYKNYIDDVVRLYSNRKSEDGTYDKSPLDPNYYRKYWSSKRCNEECKICGTTVDKTSMNRHHKTFKCQLRDINNKKKQTEAEETFNIMEYNMKMAILFGQFGKMKC